MSTSDIKANAQEVLAPVHELLQKTPTSALCKPKQDIVTLRQNLSIGDAMQVGRVNTSMHRACSEAEAMG